jgi:hypothetical protein
LLQVHMRTVSSSGPRPKVTKLSTYLPPLLSAKSPNGESRKLFSSAQFS